MNEAMLSNPVVLFRDFGVEEEFEICKKYFTTVSNRTLCKNYLVIGRYSVLPFYLELEKDLQYNGCKLINSFDQHQYIANFDYYNDVKEYTPQTWFQEDFPYVFNYDGPFVIKGRTNSLKLHWNKKMFAKTKKDAISLGIELMDNPAINEQGIIYRKYIPLKTFEYGPGGFPVTNEWRFFFLGENILSYGYYWESWCSDLSKPSICDEGINLAKECAKIISKKVNFFVLDVAEKEDGGWILIEVNDGQQSGLSLCDPEEMYRNLKKHLTISKEKLAF